LHEQQYKLMQRMKRFNVWVCHRRFGKTFLGLMVLLKQMLENQQQSPRYAYVAPYYSQAREICWDMLRVLAKQIPGSATSEASLAIVLPGNRRLRLFGADKPDSLRGPYLDGVLLDEYAQMRPEAWSAVIRPMLADRRGTATFIGTPQGQNHFYDLYCRAQENPTDWSTALLPASQTGVLSPQELASMTAEMSAEDVARELECSWVAAVPGAYFAREFAAIDAEQRIGPTPYNPAYPVQTAWDLGREDLNAIWFFQEIDGYIRFIDYVEDNNIALCPDPRRPDYPSWIRVVRRMPYNYDFSMASPPLSQTHYEQHFAPHDIDVHEYTSNKTRRGMALDAGLRFTALPPCKSLADDIEIARKLLRRSVFDAVRCAKGVKALRNYQRRFDDVQQVFADHPLHNWASHGASAFRYAAVGLRGAQRPVAPAIPEDSFTYWRKQAKRAKSGDPVRTYRVEVGMNG
jgi:hypothetical protein